MCIYGKSSGSGRRQRKCRPSRPIYTINFIKCILQNAKITNKITFSILKSRKFTFYHFSQSRNFPSLPPVKTNKTSQNSENLHRMYGKPPQTPERRRQKAPPFAREDAAANKGETSAAGEKNSAAEEKNTRPEEKTSAAVVSGATFCRKMDALQPPETASPASSGSIPQPTDGVMPITSRLTRTPGTCNTVSASDNIVDPVVKTSSTSSR